METWRLGLRHFLSEMLDDEGLERLARGVAEDDPGLVQRKTVKWAQGVNGFRGNDAEGACLLCYPAWRTGRELHAAKLIDLFCLAQETLDSWEWSPDAPGSGTALIRWFDKTPRGIMRAEVAKEIAAELARRGGAA